MADRPCPNCAQPVPTGFITCPHCGVSLGEPLPVQPPTAEPTGVPWRASEAFIVFLLHLVATAVVVGVLATQVSGDPLLVWAIFASEVVLVVITLSWVAVRHGVGPRTLGLRGFTGANLGIGVGTGLVGLLTVVIVSLIVVRLAEALLSRDVPPPEQIALEGSAEGSMLVILALSIVLLAPVAEELFFRGFLFAGLRRWARFWPSAFISGCVFSLAHINLQSKAKLIDSLITIIPGIFVLGVILAWVVEIRRSLAPAIVAHLVFNAIGFWLLFVAEPASAL